MIGLVLEGGGAKGAYHIGAYRALTELGIKIDGVVGTSIGAINGAMIAQGDGIKAWNIWEHMSNSKIFNIDSQLDEQLHREGITRNNISQLAAWMGNLIKNGGIDTSKIKAFIEEHISEQKIREADIDFGLVAVSLTKKEPLELMVKDIPEGQLLEYILASATVPGFKTEKIDGEQFVDGGLWNNLPLSLLIDREYDTLIAIRTNSVGRVKKTDHFGVPLVEIVPSEDLGPLLDFNKSSEARNLKLGYLDTLRLYRGLLGRRYFIEPHPDREWAFRLLCEINAERILEAGELLGLSPMSPRRMMLERIIPKVSAIFGLDDTMDYEDLMLTFYEKVAEKVGLDRFQIYPAQTFVEKIKEQYAQREQNVPKWFFNIAQSDPIFARLVKDDLLYVLLDIFLTRDRFVGPKEDFI